VAAPVNRRGLAAAFAIATTITISCVPGALARAHHFRLAAGHTIQFHLPGSEGFGINVTSNRRRELFLETSKGSAAVYYWLDGRGTATDGIDAKLPGNGTISVRFIPNGRQRQRQPWEICAGDGPTVHYGTVRGTIRFRGERGYTNVTAHRTKAKLITWPSQRCHLFEGHRQWTARLWAFREGGLNQEFEATRLPKQARPPARRVHFLASTATRRGRMQVYRTVTASADISSFHMPERKTAPEHLVVSPPPPFTGSASFQRTPESTFTWRGSLSVSFPGTGPVALAGPQIETEYCVRAGCADQWAEDGP
jgi:hypothetical protein